MQNKNDEEGPEMSFESWDEAETDPLKNEIESGLLWAKYVFIWFYSSN